MRLHELLNGMSDPEPEMIEEVFITPDGSQVQILHEGKWIDGRFEHNIRIDYDTHSGGRAQRHAHVLGRRGKELGVVNFDGTASHGTRMRLSKQDAHALTSCGFTIRPDRLVEWTALGIGRVHVLLG